MERGGGDALHRMGNQTAAGNERVTTRTGRGRGAGRETKRGRRSRFATDGVLKEKEERRNGRGFESDPSRDARALTRRARTLGGVVEF